MKFCTKQHQYYCGIDLHARKMWVCVLSQEREVVIHRDIHTNPEPFLNVIAPYRDDIAVAVESVFFWYWIADLYSRGESPLSGSMPFTCSSVTMGRYRGI